MLAALRLVLVLLGVVLALFFSAAEPAPLGVVVEGPVYRFEPSSVRVRIRVQPDPSNRGLLVKLLSEDYETSSYEQLDGESAPIIRWKDFRDIPAGNYLVIAALIRPPQGYLTARASVFILARSKFGYGVAPFRPEPKSAG